MGEKMNVSACDITELVRNEKESITDWIREKEVKGDQFIQKLAEVVNDYYVNQKN